MGMVEQARAGMHVPEWFAREFDAAMEAGRTHGQRIAAEVAGDGDRLARMRAAAITALPPIPDDATTAAELVQLHEVAGTRTDAQTDTARWHAAHGTSLLWEGPLAGVGSDERVAHFRETLHQMYLVNDEAKRGFARDRPFQRDPSLDTVLYRPSDGGSYPSAHASAAVAAGAVLAGMLPADGGALMTDAREVAWSRIYGGVHYLSDVVAGVQLGAAIATAMDQLGHHAPGLMGAGE